jgi:large subunit ribosomal protein L24
MANKFKKNDQVLVIAGSNKGKKGKIKEVFENKVLVEGVNLATIHKKATSNGPGQIIKTEKPIHISNVSYIEDGKPVRLGFLVEAGEGKVFSRKSRVSRKTGKKID